MKPEVPAIEQGYPLPRGRRSYGGWADVPFHKMKKGESMLFKATSQTISSALHYHQKVGHLPRGWKFTVRKVDQGVRVWRVK